MAHSPDGAGKRRYWEEAVAWRCDDEWREAYIKFDKGRSKKAARNGSGLSLDVQRAGNDRLRDCSGMPGCRKSRLASLGRSGRSLTKELERVWHAMVSLKPPELMTSNVGCPDIGVWRFGVFEEWLLAGSVEIVDPFVLWYMGGTWVVHSDRETNEADWWRHMYREYNLAADTHANWLMDTGDSGPAAQLGNARFLLKDTGSTKYAGLF